MPKNEQMPCAEAQNLLFDYLDGELGASDRARVAAHLDACQGCSAMVSDEAEHLQTLRQRVAEVRMPLPARDRLWELLREEAERLAAEQEDIVRRTIS